MPEAKTLDFCPQCGCITTVVDGHTPEGATRTFTCGETLLDRKGQITTDYTCRRLGEIARRLEATLSDAIKTSTDVRIPGGQLRTLAVADRTFGIGTFAPVPSDINTRNSVARLVELGLLEAGASKNLVRITEWGHIVYEQRKDAVT